MPSVSYNIGPTSGVINYENGPRNSGKISGNMTLIIVAPLRSRRPGTEYERKFTFMIDSPSGIKSLNNMQEVTGDHVPDFDAVACCHALANAKQVIKRQFGTKDNFAPPPIRR